MMSNDGCGLLVLVRHGQSEWNLQNRFTGWHDAALTEAGEQQARATAMRLQRSGLSFERCFVSALQRASHTLNIILQEMGLTTAEIVADKALNERDYGDLTGMNKEEASVQFGAQQVHEWRRSFDVAPPAGESLKDTAARVLPWCRKHVIVPALAGERVLVVAHGNSLRALVMELERLSEREIMGVEIATGEPLAYNVHKQGSFHRRALDD